MTFRTQFCCALLVSTVLSGNAYAYNFGYNGSDGRSGTNGRSGDDGQSIEITARGQTLDYRLDGGDGSDAYDRASDGSDAFGCHQPWDPDYNLTGADGGDGGHGGSGGNGGDGGDATIYYSTQEDLKKIRILSRGGEGGRGTYGGDGGRGCRCDRRSWSKRYCDEYRRPDGTIDRRCYMNSYFCTDGRDGFRGRDGVIGSRGRPGYATLVKSTQKLEADVTGFDGTLNEIVNQSFEFGYNQFERRSGLLQLLAPGSFMQNDYREFVGRVHYQVTVDWMAPQPIQDFQALKSSLDIRNDSVELTLPRSVWTAVEKTRSGNAIHFRITTAIKQADVENIGFQVEGQDDGTSLRILRGAQFAGIIEDTVALKIWQTGRAFGDKRIFDASVDASYVKPEGADLIVNLGTLPVDAKKAFKSKKKIKIHAVVTRKFQDRSTTVDSGEINYTIPK